MLHLIAIKDYYRSLNVDSESDALLTTATTWLGGSVVRTLDLCSKGRKFNSRPVRYQVTTLGKLFSHICLYLLTGCGSILTAGHLQFSLLPSVGWKISSSLRATGWKLVSLIGAGWYVCWLHRGFNCLPARATDARINPNSITPTLRVRDKSRTQIMNVRDTNHVADFVADFPCAL